MRRSCVGTTTTIHNKKKKIRKRCTNTNRPNQRPPPPACRASHRSFFVFLFGTSAGVPHGRAQGERRQSQAVETQQHTWPSKLAPEERRHPLARDDGTRKRERESERARPGRSAARRQQQPACRRQGFFRRVCTAGARHESESSRRPLPARGRRGLLFSLTSRETRHGSPAPGCGVSRPLRTSMLCVDHHRATPAIARPCRTSHIANAFLGLRHLAVEIAETAVSAIIKDRVIPRVLPGNTGLDFHCRVFDLGYTA